MKTENQKKTQEAVKAEDKKPPQLTSNEETKEESKVMLNDYIHGDNKKQEEKEEEEEEEGKVEGKVEGEGEAEVNQINEANPLKENEIKNNNENSIGITNQPREEKALEEAK